MPTLPGMVQTLDGLNKLQIPNSPFKSTSPQEGLGEGGYIPLPEKFLMHLPDAYSDFHPTK